MLFRSRKSRKPETLPALVNDRVNTTLPPGATDEVVIAMWLAQRPASTTEVYTRDIAALAAFTGHTPLQELNLLQLQQFAASLTPLAEATQARKISAVKSLLTFCHKAGYTTFNVGAALRAPKVEDHLAARIMSEAEVLRIIALETDPRNRALLYLLYAAGARVSEACALTWQDVGDGKVKGHGQVHFFGKGRKSREVLIKPAAYAALLEIRGNDPMGIVFQSRKKSNGGRLDRSQVNRIVEEAAIRAGVEVYRETNKEGEVVIRSRVSPHWFRHAHGSHSLDRGAPVTLVRDTLGHKSLTTTNKYSHARPDASSGTFLAI